MDEKQIILGLVLLGAYLLGSISSAVLICRLFKAPDPRALGSKNPGATNVMRVAGRGPAFLTLLADGLKGFLPLLLVSKYPGLSGYAPYVLFSVVVGHILPVFFKFKGGKGVATAYGAFLGLNWLFGAIVIVTWLVLLKLTKISSLAAVFSCLLALVLSIYWFSERPLIISIVAVSLLVLVRHYSNILRLLRKSESKVV